SERLLFPVPYCSILACVNGQSGCEENKASAQDLTSAQKATSFSRTSCNLLMQSAKIGARCSVRPVTLKHGRRSSRLAVKVPCPDAAGRPHRFSPGRRCVREFFDTWRRRAAARHCDTCRISNKTPSGTRCRWFPPPSRSHRDFVCESNT